MHYGKNPDQIARKKPARGDPTADRFLQENLTLLGKKYLNIKPALQL